MAKIKYMKKYITGFILSLLFATAPFMVMADEAQFNTSLKYGMTNSVEVTLLQNFLINQGFLRVAATGNFLSLTRQAVMDFQVSQGIINTGYFGPLTRAAANKILFAQNNNTSKVSITSVTKSSSGLASIILANERLINWQTSNYPSGVGVDINLIRKTSNTPESFSLVRKIAVNTPNDGQEKWTPQSGEIGDDMYIEVVCSSTYKFTEGCQLGGKPIKVN